MTTQDGSSTSPQNGASDRIKTARSENLANTGEAGIGKSRLMLEFAESQAGQAVLLAAGCYPGAQPVPYLPLLEALRPHLQAGRLAGRVELVWLAEASALLDE